MLCCLLTGCSAVVDWRLLRRWVRVYFERRRSKNSPKRVVVHSSNVDDAGDSDSMTLLSQRETSQPILYHCRYNYTLIDPGSRPLFDEYLKTRELLPWRWGCGYVIGGGAGAVDTWLVVHVFTISAVWEEGHLIETLIGWPICPRHRLQYSSFSALCIYIGIS